jgi:hypothetical protein
MQSDEEIGRMVASVPVAIGSVMELFSERLIQSAVGCLQNSTSKTLSPMHMYYFLIYGTPRKADLSESMPYIRIHNFPFSNLFSKIYLFLSLILMRTSQMEV